MAKESFRSAGRVPAGRSREERPFMIDGSLFQSTAIAQIIEQEGGFAYIEDQ
jgi:hypothetical protein